MVSIAHLSDLHIIDWSGARWSEFLGKRLTGASNFTLFRRKVHRLEVLESILDDLAASSVEHVAITGDVTSMAFRKELQDLKAMLAHRGLTPDRVSAVPGNHDAYIQSVCDKHLFLGELGDYATSDLHGRMPGFPFVRLRGELAFVGLDSGVARPWFMANGLVSRQQLAQLAILLEHPQVRSRFPVLLLHHPPVPYPRAFKEAHSGLIDRASLLETLERGLSSRDALILSGHWHRRLRRRLPLSGRVEVVVAPSASHLGGDADVLGAYHLIDFGPTPSGAFGPRRLRVRAYRPERGSVVELESSALFDDHEEGRAALSREPPTPETSVR